MRVVLLGLAGLALSACMSEPQNEVAMSQDMPLKGEMLSARLSGHELRLTQHPNTIAIGLDLIAKLQPDGTSEMSAERNGKPVDSFEDTETWRVEGQKLCIFDGAAPKPKDCIRVDWIKGNRIQLTDIEPDGSETIASGTLTPL